MRKIREKNFKNLKTSFNKPILYQLYLRKKKVQNIIDKLKAEFITTT